MKPQFFILFHEKVHFFGSAESHNLPLSLWLIKYENYCISQKKKRGFSEKQMSRTLPNFAIAIADALSNFIWFFFFRRNTISSDEIESTAAEKEDSVRISAVPTKKDKERRNNLIE